MCMPLSGPVVAAAGIGTMGYTPGIHTWEIHLGDIPGDIPGDKQGIYLGINMREIYLGIYLGYTSSIQN